jgi:hypothetical protein
MPAWNIAVGALGVILLVLVFFDICWTAFSNTQNGLIAVTIAFVLNHFGLYVPMRTYEIIHEKLAERKLKATGATKKEGYAAADAMYHLHPGIKQPKQTLQYRMYRRYATFLGPVAVFLILLTWIVLFVCSWGMIYFFEADNLLFAST